MKNQIVAIIPARGGSKGVPGKNIKKLNGFPLIAYSIVAAKMSKKIQRIIISTDSEEIAGICKNLGVDVPFLRPAPLAQDKSTDLEFMLHAIEWCEKKEKIVPEYWVHLRPTTPLRDPLIIDAAIDIILKKTEATSLRSGHPAPESPFKWFRKDSQGYFRGINNITNDAANNARQQFPEMYIPDGYVDVLKTSFIKHSNLMHGDKMIGFISPICTEVDTIEDFNYLEHEIAKKGSPLLDYLTMKNYKF
jgi:N-acylneuraminate cytidylyltransferase